MTLLCHGFRLDAVTIASNGNINDLIVVGGVRASVGCALVVVGFRAGDEHLCEASGSGLFPGGL